MPVSWRIADGLVRLESSETATFDEWRGAVDAALADPAFRPGMGVVHDWRKQQAALSTEEVRKRASYAEHLAELGVTRWAILVARNADYGMGRVGQAITDGVQLRAFRDQVEAEAWARGASQA